MAVSAYSIDQAALEFAYKYPFSNEARELVKQLGIKQYDEKFATAGLLRVNEDLEKPKVDFTPTSYHELMLTYLLSYVYARMLVSATANMYIVKKFAAAEADRASSALSIDSLENAVRLANELNVKLSLVDSSATIDVFEFLKIAEGAEGLKLIEMGLSKGMIELSKEQILLLVRSAIEAAVLRGLPIPKAELPAQIIEQAKQIKLPEVRISGAQASSSYAWIEKLLQTPIPDVRHRSVNLILAPYLTNVKGLDPDSAANIIIDYIEKCKQLNPNTRVNDAYIRYQCKYAKSHGLRPLSLSRAKELFKGILDLS
ncbi:MAG: DNA primase noncatalytic subunit PriX [Candidatus Micrarchaeia archaeon]